MITLSAIILLLGTPVDLSSSRTNVVVQNLCTGISVKFLTKNEIHKKNEDGMDEYELAPSIGSAYPIVVCSETQCYNYGNMTFLSGRKYIVKVSQCSLPGIRIESHEVSPVIWQDMIWIRFRSKKVRPVEYKCGQSRFRRLSVGMTSYTKIVRPVPPDCVKIQFRYRLASKGPVSYMSTHNISNFKPGRMYFVEVNYHGDQKESIKIQDEGNRLPTK